MFELLFYRWFLARLIAALSGDAGPQPRGTTVISTTAAGHQHLDAGAVVLTRGQSQLNARPRQPGAVVTVDGRTYTLGDGKRLTPPLLAAGQSTVPPITGVPWLPPPPVMPPQAAATSVAWDGPEHAAVAFHGASDGLYGHHYPRVDAEVETGFPRMGTPVEVTGVFATPSIRRCGADWRTHPEDLAFDGYRYNMRLPVMAGVDGKGKYVRVVKMPLKTFEYREPYEPEYGGGSGGDPL